MTTLDEENQQVLWLIQALLGAVSPNFRAVSIDCQDTIVLTFVLFEESAEDREEIERTLSELMAQQTREGSFATKVLVSTKRIDDILLPGRLVFLRRERAASGS